MENASYTYAMLQTPIPPSCCGPHNSPQLIQWNLWPISVELHKKSAITLSKEAITPFESDATANRWIGIEDRTLFNGTIFPPMVRTRFFHDRILDATTSQSSAKYCICLLPIYRGDPRYWIGKDLCEKPATIPIIARRCKGKVGCTRK